MEFLDLQMHQIKSFMAAAESKSFSAAAGKLFISHTSLIQQMNALEKSLGFPLFVRSTRGITLTESGRTFYSELQKHIKKLDALLSKCRTLNSAGNKVYIGNTSDLHAFYFMADFYRGFQKMYPDIEIVYVPTTGADILQLCREGKIDVSAYFGNAKPSDNEDIVFHKFSGDSMCMLMSKNDPLADGVAVTSENLEGRTVYSSTVGDEDFMYEQFPILKPGMLKIVKATMFDIYEACENGGLYICPNWQKRFFPQLKALPIVPQVEFVYYMIYRREHSPAADKMIEYYLNYESLQIK